MRKDPQIAWRHALVARTFQLIYPAMQRAFFSDPKLEFATKRIAPYTTLRVPTRHGPIDALLFSPTEEDLAAQRARGESTPVHLLTHGGAYITRLPREEGNVARYLASEIGCFVLVPDYHAAPQVRFPVAEEECFDTYLWILANGAARGWDIARVSVGGPSAGGSIALAVGLMAVDNGEPLPVAITSEFGVADVGRADEDRTSAKKSPVVPPALMRLVRNTYVKGVDLRNGYSSPLHHPRLAELPPVLVLTAEYDTLRHESNDLAARLYHLGVAVTHKEFAGVDHGFTHQKPIAVAREAIMMIGDHLRAGYSATPKAGRSSLLLG